MTTDASEFAPVLPRLATPALAPRPEPVMPPESEPGPVTDAAVDSTSAAAAPAATQAVPATAAPAPTGRRPGRSAGRVVLSALARSAIAAMVIVAAVVPVLIAREAVGPATLDPSGESAGLPRFDVAPPVYGTAQLTFSLITNGVRSTYEAQANSDATTIQLSGFTNSGVLTNAIVLASEGATYSLYADESVWTLDTRDGATSWPLEHTFARVLTFADYVPEELRRFTSVAADDVVVLDGRQLQYFELHIDTGQAASEEPLAYRDFIFYDGTTPPGDAAIRVVLYVDAAGVVWQMETFGDLPPSDRVTVTLKSFATEAFVVQTPLQYYDETNGGVLVGG